MHQRIPVDQLSLIIQWKTFKSSWILYTVLEGRILCKLPVFPGFVHLVSESTIPGFYLPPKKNQRPQKLGDGLGTHTGGVEGLGAETGAVKQPPFPPGFCPTP